MTQRLIQFVVATMLEKVGGGTGEVEEVQAADKQQGRSQPPEDWLFVLQGCTTASSTSPHKNETQTGSFRALQRCHWMDGYYFLMLGA